MAKKTKKYAGKTEKQWRDFGEEFGKRMDKVAVKFSERMERAGRKSKRRSWEQKECCYSMITPILGAVIQVFILAIGLWILKSINFLNISLISNFYWIIINNLHWFFAAFILFGYDDYARKTQENYWTLAPLFNSFRVIFSLWIATLVIELINIYTFNTALNSLVGLFYSNIARIFLMFLVLLYVAAFIGKTIEVKKWHKK
jgi:hypothetical protein